MTANILLKLWKLRIWFGVGGFVATVAAVASLTMFNSIVYAGASTEMLVDSPQSALANAGTDLSGYLTRANVFARLMTSAEALQYIGQAAGVPSNLIAASGPVEVNGSPQAAHSPVAIQRGQDVAARAQYKLQFNQNPLMPTVDVYAEAPTSAQAIKLANGAVTGFAAFLNQLYAATHVAPNKHIEIRQLGGATGGLVDPGASKKMAGIVFVAVLALWCALVLFVSNLRRQLRTANLGEADAQATPDQSRRADYLPPEPEQEIIFPPSVVTRDGQAHFGHERRPGALGGKVEQFVAESSYPGNDHTRE